MTQTAKTVQPDNQRALREEARRLLDEAQASPDRDLRKALHRQAFELAQVVDMMESKGLAPSDLPIIGYPQHPPKRRVKVRRKVPPISNSG